MDWMREEQKFKSERRPQISCFNARIDFLNNLSDGIAKKLPKQRKTSSSRQLEMPLPPGCFPAKISLALSKSSNSLCSAGSESTPTSNRNFQNNTMSTTIESVIEPDVVAMESRIDTWYASLCKSSSVREETIQEEQEVLLVKQPLTPAPRRVTEAPAFQRLSKLGASLKLQNGSYPMRYSSQKGGKNNNNNNNNNSNNVNRKNEKNAMKKKQRNTNKTIEHERDVSLASDFQDDSMSNISSELYDEESSPPFSRSSTPFSDAPSIVSEQTSMLSVDSTYGTSEFSMFSSASKSSRDYMYDFERLTNVLDHIDGEVLKQQLKECLMSKKARNIKSLSSLLPANKFTGNTSHCFRCHSEYDHVHGNPTCVLRHPQDDVLLISEDGSSAVFQCERCACVFKLNDSLEYDEEKTDLVNCGACYVGQHTNISKKVNYSPGGVAKTCNQNGCAIFYV